MQDNTNLTLYKMEVKDHTKQRMFFLSNAEVCCVSLEVVVFGLKSLSDAPIILLSRKSRCTVNDVGSLTYRCILRCV